LERIVQDRDPRDAWAFVQRICGVCTHIHAIASIQAVEDALDITVPKNAVLIRQIMTAAQFVQDHVIHFYHLHALDWIDVVSALKADPKVASALAQSLSNYARSSPGHFADVQKTFKSFVDSGQLGIFANAYWGHPAYKLPPEVNLIALSHYLDALDGKRISPESIPFLAVKIRIPTIWWGGWPVPSTLTMTTPSIWKDWGWSSKKSARPRHLLSRFTCPICLPSLLFIKTGPMAAGSIILWFTERWRSRIKTTTATKSSQAE
jgi:Ni,Fe-hydrogenase I large subunit